MNFVKAFIWFLILEFLIILFVFILTGTFSTDGTPLQIIQDISTSIGTSVWAIGTGFFIIGTFLNLVTMFVNIAHSGGEW